MATNGWRIAAAVVIGVCAVLVLMSAQAAAHCRPWHPHHCVKEIPIVRDIPGLPDVVDIIDEARDEAERLAKEAADETERLAEEAADEVERLGKEAERMAKDVEDEVLEPAIHWIGDIFEGDFEMCDCSKTMEEQEVSHCEVPEPPCPPDSPHAMGSTPREPVEEVLPTDICGLIRYVRMDGDNTIYRGIGYGAAWIVEDGGTALKVSVSPTPNRQYILKPSQGWNCGDYARQVLGR